MLSSSSCNFRFCNTISSTSFISTTTTNTYRRSEFTHLSFLNYLNSKIRSRVAAKPTVLLKTLEILEWDKLCDLVSSFATTPLGRNATKEQLWSLDQTYEESLRLLTETRAAVDILNYHPKLLDFNRIHVLSVTTGINHVRTDSSVDGQEAIAIANLLRFAKSLQININYAIRGSNDLRLRVKPLADLILDLKTNESLVRSILQVVNENGSIKDSASQKLEKARRRVTSLNNDLFLLMNTLIANEASTRTLEASKKYGRWCIRSEAGQLTRFKGLLVSSGVGDGNIIEPVCAVSLNDELQEEEAAVAEAEAEVLLDITEKMKPDLDGIVKLLYSIVKLDVVNARASYSLSVNGTCPELLLLDGKSNLLRSEGSKNDSSNFVYSNKKQRMLHISQVYHPLLVQSHKQDLEEARRDAVKSTSMGLKLYFQFRRKKMQTQNILKQEVDPEILQEKVTQLEKAHPTPVDFVVDINTRVVLISGPNMGGKTVCLKTLGLAAIMAKAGLYILCSEPAKIPWFDSVLADIGDQQSLYHSLSTFSGHLKQISDIQAKCTSQSLVLLDEIGAGTNPLEGAALGMSILESCSVSGALLTVATTHHGELKTLKYCNEAFENASMEYDEVYLKPTYKILWGVPGRSKAMNIAERLGMLEIIVSNARKLYGAASAEIDEVIFDLEKSRQEVEEYVHKVSHYLRMCKDVGEKLMLARRRINESCSNLNKTKMQQTSEIALRVPGARIFFIKLCYKILAF
ncbi:uncharacterized protein LOC141606869 [Silene latifolia]|uniref:uncharacterized protein LOC141606869 n=1 Tax=Silene latifolia TaxID=37657 RepID=UPI003D77AE61